MQKKGIIFICILLACAMGLPNTITYSEESLSPPATEMAENVAAIGEEKVSYVKPGYVTVNFKDADIIAVLNYLAEVSGVDIVPSPDVAGTVTLKLTDKPWEVALDIIVKNYGYAYEREGDIIRVVTLDSLQKEELVTEVIHLNYTSAEETQEAIKDMLTERGKITYDSRINALLVTDLPTNTYRIKQVVERLDRKTPQVMIEARIYETLLEKDEKMGIDWSIKIAIAGASRPTTIPFDNFGGIQALGSEIKRYFPFGQTGTASTDVQTGGTVTTSTLSEFPTTPEGTVAFPFVETDSFTYGTLDFSQFQAVLEILKQRRRTEIVSNPRITTLNHREAKILVGRVYNFPIFDQSEMTGRWVISGYQAKELGIKLLVTPHVNKNNEIVVELTPEISNFLGLEKISEELSAPLWSTRVADTQVMVKDGDTIFIGGLVRENNIDVDKKIPILGDLFGDIPIFGGLFKSKGQDQEKTELIFFITVHIIDDVNKLTYLVTRDLLETKMPDDIAKKAASAAPAEPEVFIDLPVPGAQEGVPSKNNRKPLFDFRKKKK